MANGGHVKCNDGETIISLSGEVAYCFKPYSDINRFYYEI